MTPVDVGVLQLSTTLDLWSCEMDKGGQNKSDKLAGVDPDGRIVFEKSGEHTMLITSVRRRLGREIIRLQRIICRYNYTKIGYTQSSNACLA